MTKSNDGILLVTASSLTEVVAVDEDAHTTMRGTAEVLLSS
jgi:hypothetical protein